MVLPKALLPTVDVIIYRYYDIQYKGMHPEDSLSLDEWYRLLVAASAQREATLLWLSSCGNGWL
jgi:hypothetical protein